MKTSTLNALANSLAYITQDVLDEIAQGGRFDFQTTEKEIKKQIRAFLKEEKKNSNC